MPEPTPDLLLEILKACAAAEPQPLYPAAFAAESGLEREFLDESLDSLRLKGLVRLTDWAAGKGQGYALTPAGATMLDDPNLLRRGRLPQPASEAPDTSVAPLSSHWERGEAIRLSLLEPKPPYVTYTLLGINLVMFFGGLLLGLQRGVSLDDYLVGRSGQLLTSLGALNLRDVIFENDWWRLLTYGFLHGGALHLLMNMYCLYSLGPLMESVWGSGRYLALYLISVFAGGLAVMIAARALVTVGASGAICGLMGSFGAWVFLNKQYLPPQVVSQFTRAIMTNLILMVVISTMPGISWEGHLGGAVGGALYSFPLNNHRYGSPLARRIAWLGLILLPLAAFVYIRSHYAPLQAQAQWEKVGIKVQTTFDNFAWAIVNNWDPAEATPKAKDAVYEMTQQLPSAVGTLREAAFFSFGAQKQEVEKSRLYFEEWLDFYSQLDATLSSNPPWSKEMQDDLVERYGRITKLMDQWRPKKR
ncbi:MAG: rhomboid family intramembrane serine protease [Gemmataceae bacterium]|nr:rhomboid family intramembrane serine protease [Gemmataceae bacterium]MCI0738186.1 rhomboid family intramembrane serine protease [Gemmataceae bacterium]